MRERLIELEKRRWSKRDALWVEALAERYEVPRGLDREATLTALLEHVDTIPVSLVLAQAAKESAWGSSRFAVEGNNYFGQRCYAPGCGMVPDARAAGRRFEVQRFDSVAASVSSYMFNINRHREYAGLRAYRAERRRAGKDVSGIQAAEQLAAYSERRRAYVDEIQSLIHFNKLDNTP